MQKENNKLKLDNAALRAENSLLKKHLSYFENLFAKKTQILSTTSQAGKDSTVNTEGGITPVISSANPSKASSKCGGLSDDEIYNVHSYNIKKRNGYPLEEVYSTCSVADNEARDFGQKVIHSAKGTASDVGFYLGRADGSSSSSPGKLGLFTVALVMCVCCVSSFFGGPASDVTIATNIRSSQGQGLFGGGMSLKMVDGDYEETSTPSLSSADPAISQQILIPRGSYSFLSWGTFFKLLFLVFFAITVLTFPLEDVKQWAARRAWLRKVFNLNDIPIQASKNIKNL